MKKLLVLGFVFLLIFNLYALGENDCVFCNGKRQVVEGTNRCSQCAPKGSLADWSENDGTVTRMDKGMKVGIFFGNRHDIMLMRCRKVVNARLLCIYALLKMKSPEVPNDLLAVTARYINCDNNNPSMDPDFRLLRNIHTHEVLPVKGTNTHFYAAYLDSAGHVSRRGHCEYCSLHGDPDDYYVDSGPLNFSYNPMIHPPILDGLYTDHLKKLKKTSWVKLPEEVLCPKCEQLAPYSLKVEYAEPLLDLKEIAGSAARNVARLRDKHVNRTPYAGTRKYSGPC